MSTHDESSGSRFSSGSGGNYNAEGQDPVNLFAESGYGSSGSGKSGASSFGSSEASGPADDSALGKDPSSFDFGSYGDQPTSMLANLNEPANRLDEDYADTRRLGSAWHGGADLGLLVLRIVVGGTFGVYGLQHLFRLFNGTGIDAFGRFLQAAGYHYPTVMAWVGGGAELVGGALLVLGLFTPAAAGALLAVVSNVIVLKWHFSFFDPNGWQFQLVLAAAAFALLFAGPGRVSLDRPTPWYRHPVGTGWTFLFISAAASVCVLLLLRTHH
ncbi:MAG TPA: DoxX family protein [Pseudonocardiaceae bacterium]|nr:DoxX family protein [Pseudonocardiaceae bacterium]